MNIGLDFGSTYSILSRYRENQKVIEAFQDKNSVTIPSMVCVNNNKVKIGGYAKGKTAKKGFRTFKAFKMLLMEENKKFIRDRQYDDTYSPRWATQEFMSQLIQKSQETFQESQIEHLVVGAPDVWFHSFDTLSGRGTVRDICTAIPGVKDVRIVSEPVLASAYFAYNYQKNSNKPFEGNILIVDYGGGTLDLSLTEIKSIKGNASEIKMLESNGAGENTDHSIGNAGIVYMESLMEYVLRKNNPEEADKIIGTGAFYEAVNSLENELIEAAEDIRDDIESEGGISYLEDLEEIQMGADIMCSGSFYEVTLADLVIVYNKVIRPVFDKKMQEMIDWAKKEHHIDVFNKQSDKFRIALVGGFGNFYLVRQQMHEKFQISSDSEDMFDKRKKYIITNQQDCERAISYGASLVASGVYGICSTAPYSIGITSRINGSKNVDYMVHYLDEIDLEKPYYIQENGADKIICLGEGWADEFIIDYGRTNPEKIRFRAKKEFREKLEGIIKNDFKTCTIGISFNASDVVTLHIREYIYDIEKANYKVGIETSYELGEFKNVFEEIR